MAVEGVTTKNATSKTESIQEGAYPSILLKSPSGGL